MCSAEIVKLPIPRDWMVGSVDRVSKQYKCYRVKAWETNNGNLWINVILGAKTILICGVYIPPPLVCERIEDFIHNVEKIMPE